MDSGIKGCFNMGEVNPKKTVTFKYVSPGLFSLAIGNFESSCEIVLETSEVKQLIGTMVNEI